jgi:hypothetical protein
LIVWKESEIPKLRMIDMGSSELSGSDRHQNASDESERKRDHSHQTLSDTTSSVGTDGTSV